MEHRPTMLVILDGYGIREEVHGNAIAAARKPHLDALFSHYPFITIEASGLPVGLPDGQIGNSEVGHTNIGAGNVIYQDLPRITRAIEDGSFFRNPVLVRAMENAAAGSGHQLHVMGLLSDGGVHSHIKHLFAIIDMAKEFGVSDVIIHCFLDGRDVPPRSAGIYFRQLEQHIAETGTGRIGLISGRFYAMDRDKRWERLIRAYDALTLGEGLHAADPEEALAVSYAKDESDEFVQPTIVGEGTIRDGDSVIFINFRPDRAREITRALVDEDFDGFERKVFPRDLTYVCMTEYDASMPNVELAYPPESVEPTLGSVAASHGLRQLRIAETEKYAHVTFFFNGGKEEPEEGEDRILVPSPKVATYDLQPEMSAPIVTEKVLEAIASDRYDLIILNFANPDMVGHTGVFDAAVQAIETLDGLVWQIVEAVLAKDGQVLLTADHGNADYMLDENDNIVTKHSLSKVPLCHICREPRPFIRDTGKLADITPTLLTLMGIPVPEEMHGDVLVQS
ncbi:MAG: 2,3-bisphosphoglycerate-independent phosphoglycerate mutase [Mogibacterium sp.]|nr:2,3-bisphosphoglycerate-independent phosphoglycerate mutase [Mogibacterium sp.]